jgi:hypothetical protein
VVGWVAAWVVWVVWAEPDAGAAPLPAEALEAGEAAEAGWDEEERWMPAALGPAQLTRASTAGAAAAARTACTLIKGRCLLGAGVVPPIRMVAERCRSSHRAVSGV